MPPCVMFFIRVNRIEFAEAAGVFYLLEDLQGGIGIGITFCNQCAATDVGEEIAHERKYCHISLTFSEKGN